MNPKILSLSIVTALCLTPILSPAATVFTDVTASTLGNVQHLAPDLPDIKIGTGAVWFDYDRDGDLDLYMTNRVGANRLWRNEGAGKFTEVAASVGVTDSSHDGSGVAAADFDNDDDLDLYLANSDNDVFFKNQLTETGTATFTDETARVFPGIATPERGTSAAWGDYDRDGYLDLYVSNHRELPDSGAGHQDRLFHNQGNGTFVDVSFLLLGGDANGDGSDDNLGGYGFIGGWTDYDQDGDLDILLINDCPFGPENTKLFRNDGGTDPMAWNFTEAAASVGAGDCRNGMGLAFGDYNRDGWSDYFYTNAGSPLLLRNDSGHFTDATAIAGLDDAKVPETGGNRITWGTIFFDYDLDGYLDLCVAAGAITASTQKFPNPNLLYHNDGNGVSFTDVTAESGIGDTGRGRTVIMGDYDRDGDPDLFLVNHGENVFLFRNDYANGTGRHWLIVELQGAGPPLSNRDGVGSRIKITTADGASQSWETRSGDSLGGGSDLAAYFGLNTNTSVATLQVIWPSGTVQILSSIAADRRLTVVEEAAAAPAITVTSPNGKESLAKGSAYNITWTDNIVGEVVIRLLDGRRVVSVISPSTESDGSFTWAIPASLPVGNTYKVEVRSKDERTISDLSDRRFTLVEASAPRPR